jgi:hypothetical protein
MTLFEGLLTPESRVTIDDGGVRAAPIYEKEKRGQWIPFTTIVDSRVDFGLFGVALLRLVTRDGTITLRVPHDDALFVHATLLPHVGATPSAVSAALARNGRPVDEWLADVRSRAQSDGYREAAMSTASLVATLEDGCAPAEARAAAAHALLYGGREDDVYAVVRAFATHALPPIVVVVAALAPGGAALVPDVMWDEALAYLTPAEVEEAERAQSYRVQHENEAHLRELLERATAEEIAAANARRAAEPGHVASRRKHHASPLGGFAASQGVSRFK